MTLLTVALVVFEIFGFAAWVYLVATRGLIGAFNLLRDWLVAAWELLKHGRHRSQIANDQHPDRALIRRLEHDTHRPIEQLITEAENIAIREANATSGHTYAELDAQRRRTVTLPSDTEFRPACDDCEWDSVVITSLSGPIHRSWTRVRPCDKHRDEKPTLRPIATRPSPVRAPDGRL